MVNPFTQTTKPAQTLVLHCIFLVLCSLERHWNNAVGLILHRIRHCRTFSAALGLGLPLLVVACPWAPWSLEWWCRRHWRSTWRSRHYRFQAWNAVFVGPNFLNLLLHFLKPSGSGSFNLFHRASQSHRVVSVPDGALLLKVRHRHPKNPNLTFARASQNGQTCAHTFPQLTTMTAIVWLSDDCIGIWSWHLTPDSWLQTSPKIQSWWFENPPTPLWRWRRAYLGATASYTKCSITFVNIAVAISALAGGGQKRFRTETRIRWCFRHFSRIFGCLSARGYWNGILGHFGSFPAMEKRQKKKTLYICT